jgi:hypothetical protein
MIPSYWSMTGLLHPVVEPVGIPGRLLMMMRIRPMVAPYLSQTCDGSNRMHLRIWLSESPF